MGEKLYSQNISQWNSWIIQHFLIKQIQFWPWKGYRGSTSSLLLIEMHCDSAICRSALDTTVYSIFFWEYKNNLVNNVYEKICNLSSRIFFLARASWYLLLPSCQKFRGKIILQFKNPLHSPDIHFITSQKGIYWGL